MGLAAVEHERIVPAVAVQPIGLGAAVEFVVVASAVQRVSPRSAREDVPNPVAKELETGPGADPPVLHVAG